MTQQQQLLSAIVTPHDHDVLSGRGNFVNYHAGNEHFRALVRKHKVAYVACPKPQKGKFSKMIVDEIKNLNPPGRFLKQDPVTKLWHDIGEKKALDKTRQALREGAPEIMKELTTDDDEDGCDGQMPQQQPTETLSPVRSQKPSPQISTPTETISASLSKTILASSPAQVANYVNLGNSSHHAHAGLGNSSHHANLGNSSHQQHYDCFSPNAHAPAAVGLSVSLHSDVSPSNVQLHQQATVLGSRSHHLPQHHTSLGIMHPPRPQQPTSSRQPHLVDPLAMSHPGQTQLMQQQQRMMGHQPLSHHDPSGLLGLQSALMGDGHNSDLDLGSVSDFSSFLPKNLQQLNPAPFLNDELEPRPIAPSMLNQLSQQRNQMPQQQQQQQQEDHYGESERVAPLPARKNLSQLSKLGRRGELKREGSENSLQVDSLFAGIDNHKQGTGTALGNHLVATKPHNPSHGSSAHLSLMSLSIGDMALSVGEPTPSRTELHSQPQQLSSLSSQLDHNTNPEQLATRFNNSLRFGRHLQKNPPKRLGSGVETAASGESVGHVMDMSVATLGLSEVGEMSIARMSESQANMSFSNVFEDNDRDTDPLDLKPR